MVLKKMSGTPPKTYRAPSNLLLNSTTLTTSTSPITNPHCASGCCTFEGWGDVMVCPLGLPHVPPKASPSTPDSLARFRTFQIGPLTQPGSLAYFLFYFTDSCMFPILFSLPDTLNPPCLHFDPPTLDPDVGYISLVSDSIPD